LGELPIEPDTPAKIVIDEKTGTVVIGRDVRISPVAVAQGSITVRVTEMPTVVQPLPFSRGRTETEQRTEINANEAGGSLNILAGPNLQTLVSGLNRMGLKPMGIIAILQAIKSAGALQAELVVQ
jgi:flagellar P-ring protein precursor FlgI